MTFNNNNNNTHTHTNPTKCSNRKSNSVHTVVSVYAVINIYLLVLVLGVIALVLVLSVKFVKNELCSRCFSAVLFPQWQSEPSL